MSRRHEDDEGPVPAERYLHLPDRLGAGDLGAAVARGVIEYFSDAENLAGFSGSMLLLAVARGRRLPLIPALMISGMGQLGGRMAYRSYKNLEILAQVALKEKGSEGS